jgi:hypothetical protein
VNLSKHFRAYALVLLITSFHSWSAQAKDKPHAKAKLSFRVDLKQFGYITDAAEYSSLGFLSNDLLLLVVNQRVFYPVQPLTTDSPASTFIVFDVAKKQTLHSAQMMVTKSPRSVAVLSTGDFLVASLSDVRLCSADLQCKKSFPSHGGPPLDSDEARKITGMDVALQSDDVSIDGSRAVSADLSSTMWNKISHPFGNIDEPTSPDSRRISVYDNRSRKTLISLHYDPKNHVIGPALSPNGTTLGVVSSGALEIFELP